MNPVVVSNSTPLIALASIGRFSALRELFTQIHIPEAVLTIVYCYAWRSSHPRLFQMPIQSITNLLLFSEDTLKSNVNDMEE